MYVVAVTFTVAPEHIEDFHEAVVRQSRNSLENEESCQQFDVCQDPEDPTRFFLYELYDNEAAFEAHRQTVYFSEFGATVEPMVQDKSIQIFQRIEP